MTIKPINFFFPTFSCNMKYPKSVIKIYPHDSSIGPKESGTYLYATTVINEDEKKIP